MKHEIVIETSALPNYKLVRCSCGYKPQPKIAAFDLDPDDDLAIHIAAQREPILGDRVITPGERVIEAMAERPGWVPGMQVHDEISFEQLDQATTDEHIVLELALYYVRPNERAEFDRLVPAPVSVGTTHHQRGGIHSDPMMRVLAFRAWGLRDLDWTPTSAYADSDAARLVRAARSARMPARDGLGKSTPSRRAQSLHDRHCTNENCDGQCVER